ncbi:MAG TPA: hypothetical protein H9898_07310, partial [Candidatus Anaerobiospirillum stercoravium]|nr:hypothetical protein [Candidatus Anaerobiospirillum stercoravium]
MVELLPSVDAWCSYLGWTLLALGLVSCLFPRTFKLGVIVMILGNIPLILGIAAPRRVMEWVINRGVAPSQFPSVEQSHSLGIASGVVIFILLFLLYWYPLRGRKGSRYYFWQRGKQRLSDDDPIMSADGQLATDQAVSKNSKRTKKPRVSTMHLKSGDNPLSLKDTSKAHDELTQIDAEREPTLSSDLFTKRGPRRAAARAQAHKGKGPGRAVPGPAAPAAGATSTAASGAAGAAPQERSAPTGSNLGLGSGYPRAHTAVSGAEVPPPSLGSFLSRLDAMTAGAEHPASAIPDAVIPGGSSPLVNEPHVSAGVTAPEPQLSGHKVGELLQDLNSNATAPERAAGGERLLSGSRANGGSGNDGGSGSGGSFSFAEILSSASSRQSKLEAAQQAEQQAAAHGATAPGDASDLSTALSAHGPTVRPSARTSAPVEEALQELGALSDDEIDLSREAKLGQAPSGPDKTKLYSPGRTVGQALAELDQAIPTEAEVISSEQPHALETPTAPDSDDLITALSAAEVEVVNASELSATASKEAAAAQAQDLAPERVQSIKSLEAELEAKEAALKAREAALEAQQAALKAKEAMLALGSKEAETAAAAPAPAPTATSASAAPRAAAPSSAPSAAPSQEHSDDLPSASYSFVLSSPRKESARAPSKLPHFAGDSTSYSFELDFKSAPYHKEQRAEASAPTKQVKVEATFSEQRLSAEPKAPEEPKAPAAPEVSAAARAAQAQAEQRVQQTKEAKRQRDEAMWQRAEHVAHELLNEVQSLDESAPLPAPMSAEQLSAQPAPIKAPRRTKSNLPYALTADYTDAGQDEARSLAALLKGDADLVHTMEQVKAQTDAALIAADVASPGGLKSLGGNVPQSAQRYSLLEDSAEVERMFETITRVLQENAETQAGATPATSAETNPAANAGATPETNAGATLTANAEDNAELSAEPSLTTTPASAAARLHVAAPEAAPQPLHPQPPHTTQDQSGPMGALELNEPDNGALHLEPAAASQPPQSAPAAARKSAVARSARKIAAARPTGAPKTAPAAVPAAAPQPAPERKRAAPATTEPKVDATSTTAATAERKSARRAAPTVAPARPASAAERHAAKAAPQRKAPVRAAAAAAQLVAKSAPKVAAPKMAAASPATAQARPATQEERAVAPQAAAPKAKPSVRKAAQAAADGAELKLHTPALEITPAAPAAPAAPPAATPAPAAQVPAPAQAAPAKPRHSLKAKRRSAAAE